MPDPVWMPISVVPPEWQNLFIEHAISGAFPVRALVSRVGPPADYLERWIREAEELAAAHPDFSGKRFEEWFADRKRTARFFMADPVSVLINETDPSAIRMGPDAPPRDVLLGLDFSTCSKVERWGPENMHGQREGYTLTAIEFDARPAVALGYPVAVGLATGAEDEDDPSETVASADEITDWILNWSSSRIRHDRDEAWRDFRADFGGRAGKREAFRGFWTEVRRQPRGRPKLDGKNGPHAKSGAK